MKKLLIILAVVFTWPAFAAYIPPSLYGLSDSTGGAFTYTDSNANLDDSGFEMRFEFGDFNSPDTSFGMFQFDIDTYSAVNQLQIFNRSDHIGSDSNVVWDFLGDTVSTKYGSQDLISNIFGLYFHSDGETYYSLDFLNPGGEDFFGFYWEDDPYSDANLYAYASDGESWGNLDLIKVAVNDVQQILVPDPRSVPEPETMALFGLAMLGLGIRRRKIK